MVRRLRRRWTCLTARFRFSAKTRAAMRWKKPSSRRNRPFGRAVLDRAGSHGRIPSPRAPRARCKPDDGSKAPRPGAAGRLWRRRRPKPRNRIPGRRLRELQGPVAGDRQGRPEATRGARLKPPESGSGAAPRAPHMRPQVRLFPEPILALASAASRASSLSRNPGSERSAASTSWRALEADIR